MSLKLLNTAIFSALELSLNSLLKLDQQALSKIQKLSGSVLTIKATTPELAFTATFHQQGIHLSPHNDAPADVSITGSATALLSLLTSTKDRQSFYADNLSIEGNVEILQELQNIFTALNLDWEFFLSKFIGDIPTQTASEGFHLAKKFAQNSSRSLAMDLDDYIHQEKQLFPDKPALEVFYSAIDELRLRVDRADARLTQIQDKISQ